jgi:hypothetical protein
MGMSELRVSLTCDCGRPFSVGSGDAGNLLNCDCGRSISVPSLSKLRSLVGKDAYVTNPAETIRKIQSAGGNPAGERCVLCGSPSPVFYACYALCEATQLKRADDEPNEMIFSVIKYFVFGPLAWLPVWRRGSKGAEVVGHEVQVTFTLPVCEPCARIDGNLKRPRLAKQLMANVPIYKELLAYYPQLTLTVEQPA